MTTALGPHTTRFSRLTLAVAAVVALTPWFSLAAPAAATELDPVPMVPIPAGEFLMGSPDGQGRADERPQRAVFLDAFVIDQVEVTNERYMKFVKTTGHRSPPNPYGTGPLASLTGIEHLPVVQTTWYDAQAYCTWAKKRLPTEAEWEKAARGPMAAATPGAMSPRPSSGRRLIGSGKRRRRCTLWAPGRWRLTVRGEGYGRQCPRVGGGLV